MAEVFFLLVINPEAGKSRFQHKFDLVSHKLKKLNLRFSSHLTERDAPEKRLRNFLLENPEITDIIVIGGDGTINDVLNALPHFHYRLGFISNGTGNDSIKPFHLSKETDKQLETILTGVPRKIDLGRCNGRLFMNGVGIGFDGEIVNEMLREKRKKKGHWAYLSVVLKMLWKKVQWPVSIRKDDDTIEQKIFSITVAKGTTFGGGFVMNPRAKKNDGLLDICIFDHLPLWKRLYVLPSVQLGIHGSLSDVNFHKAKKITIQSSVPIKAHIDGELIQDTRFEVEVVPEAVEVWTPE